MIVFQAEHNILMHPFHMLGVAGVFGAFCKWFSSSFKLNLATGVSIGKDLHLLRRKNGSVNREFLNREESIQWRKRKLLLHRA
jgi:hypothetical protein